MHWNNERLERLYERIQKEAMRDRFNFTEEEVASPYLHSKLFPTKSFRTLRFIKLAYYLGQLRGIHHVDEMDTPITMSDNVLERKKTYIVLTTRHDSISIHGSNYGLFWGYKDSKSGYTSDPRFAHRYTEEEAKDFSTEEDIPLDISKLGLEEGYPEACDSNLVTLVEKSTINKLYGLNLLSVTTAQTESSEE